MDEHNSPSKENMPATRSHKGRNLLSVDDVAAASEPGSTQNVPVFGTRVALGRLMIVCIGLTSLVVGLLLLWTLWALPSTLGDTSHWLAVILPWAGAATPVFFVLCVLALLADAGPGAPGQKSDAIGITLVLFVPFLLGTGLSLVIS
jgi:hypothetical protein